LVHSPEAQARAALLAHWYPLILLRTMIFERLHAAEVIEAHFDWPIFLKAQAKPASTTQTLL
jgi:hypothetical protein